MLAQTTIVWRDAVRRDASYRRRYADRYRPVRFEDVVRQPDETLGALFAFLGVELPPDPTNVRVMAHGFRWGEEGIDAGAAERWRGQIGRFPNAWLRFFLGSYMRRLGYRT